MKRILLDVYPPTWPVVVSDYMVWGVATLALKESLPNPELWHLSMPPIEVQRGHSVMFTRIVRRNRGAFR